MSLSLNGVGSSCLSASFRKESAGRFTPPLLYTFFIFYSHWRKVGQGDYFTITCSCSYRKTEMVSLEGTYDEANAFLLLLNSILSLISRYEINLVLFLPPGTYTHLFLLMLCHTPHPPWLIVKAGQCLSLLSSRHAVSLAGHCNSLSFILFFFLFCILSNMHSDG